MKKLRVACMLVGILLSVVSGRVAGGHEADPLAAELMDLAAQKDTEGLMALEARAMKSPSSRFAYHLARYIADPDGYVETFIVEFPTSSDAVMGYIYKLEISTRPDGGLITPRFLYSFDALGMLASAGRASAVGKLYRVAIHADAVVSEFVCERIAQIITRETSIALDELAKLSMDDRRHVYGCFGTASSAEISQMRSSLETREDGEQAEIAREVGAALDRAY
jgi:hypothetical protein